MLDPNEMIEADGAHTGMPFHCWIKNDCYNQANKEAKAAARARHETINRRFKQFRCLDNRYRHDRSKHKIVFQACAVCVQAAINLGEIPFQANC